MDELAAIVSTKRFLVVDDVGSMRAIAANQLRQLGAVDILEAANGADALRILALQPVDMILSDWDMPGISGLELLEAVRQDARLQATPFVMITAEVERDHVHRAVAAGVSAILVKPYSSGRFADRIRQGLRWTERPSPPGAASPAARPAAARSPASPRRATVLAVDDTPDNLQLLSDMLKDEYRVKAAPSGEKALAICQTDDPPDLVLLDVMMPGMDGFAVLEQLRGHPSSEHIPVIFVTALNDQESRAKGMRLGAVDFVTKPIEPDTLRVRIRNFMRYVELHRQLQADYDEMLETARLREEVERMTRQDIREPLCTMAKIASSLAASPGRSVEDQSQLRAIEETALRVLDSLARPAAVYKLDRE